MPTQIAFYSKADGERVKDLAALDSEIREHFNQPPDPDNWLSGWMDSIGMRIALGWKLDEQRMIDAFATLPGLESIRQYLAEHYDTDCYRVFK